jgi:hypothetical protein
VLGGIRLEMTVRKDAKYIPESFVLPELDGLAQGVLDPASRHCTWAKPAWTNGTCQWTAVNMEPWCAGMYGKDEAGHGAGTRTELRECEFVEDSNN